MCFVYTNLVIGWYLITDRFNAMGVQVCLCLTDADRKLQIERHARDNLCVE